MEITLQALHISGFKGINSLNIDFHGQSAIISGENGTGKTSVFDSVLWLLFGKDSTDAKADVKPVDENGNRVSGKDVDVTATYSVDGKAITLRKQLREVWSKPVGSTEQVYTRDETLCWINDVPKKVDREYTPEVAAIFGGDESTFKLLSSYTAFMALHWTERRKQLFRLTSDPLNDPTQRIAGFERIGDILLGNTPEDAKKRLMEQRKRLNDALNAIPARIDELQRSIREVGSSELDAAKQNVANCQAEIDTIDGWLTGADEAGKKLNEIIARKTALERKKLTAETMLASDYHGALTKLKASLHVYESETKLNQSEIVRIEEAIRKETQEINALEEAKATLRAEYDDIQHEAYQRPDNMESLCPTCGQHLPESMIEEAYAKQLALWQKQKAGKIALNVEEGKRVRARIVALQEHIGEEQARIGDLKEAVSNMQPEAEEASRKISEAEAAGMPTTSPEIEAIKGQIALVDAELTSIGTNEQAEALRQRKRELNALIANGNAIIATAGANANNIARVAELEKEKQTTGAILSSIENDLNLLGQYVSARCKLLEESINERFTTIKWKLFDVQKNGEIRDCCEATVNGIPYGSGLNNAAEVNAGIEIIRVMSDAYRIHVPCFVDNVESVNHPASTGGQMILLKVTEEPKLSYTLL